MNKLIRSTYKFITKPRIRYSIFMEGLRRLFCTYTTREIIMRRAMEWAFFRGLKGDYMEFGVYQGDSFIKAFHFARFAQLSDMKFYAFDSFSGYPPLQGIDKESGLFKENNYRADLKTFKNNLLKGKVDMKKVKIIEGPFDKLKEGPRIESKKASVVWIDCDLYNSTLEVLDFLTDYIVEGTIIIFADWFTCNGVPDLGQPRAVREWLQKNPLIKLVEFFNFGEKSFIVSKTKKNVF